MNVGDVVIVNNPESIWNGYNGYVTWAGKDMAEVELSATGTKIWTRLKYLVKYNSKWNESSSGDEVFGDSGETKIPDKKWYVKTELTVAGYERLNELREKYRVFSNRNIGRIYYYIKSMEAAREFCQALIMCTQNGLTMDDEDDDFLIEICEELGWGDLMMNMYAFKTGDKIKER